VGSSTSHNPIGLRGLWRIALLYFTQSEITNCFQNTRLVIVVQVHAWNWRARLRPSYIRPLRVGVKTLADLSEETGQRWLLWCAAAWREACVGDVTSLLSPGTMVTTRRALRRHYWVLWGRNRRDCGWWSIFGIISGIVFCDRLCGIVVSVSGYISRGPGSIPGVTRFSKK
jgi:hypothetical protein